MKAVILFSGGVDSTLMLALALDQGRDCFALSFDYGQRHVVELEAAKRIAEHYGVAHKIIKIDPEGFGKSPLVGGADVPRGRERDAILADSISPFYVPARNTLFLSYALSHAEALGAEEIWHGGNAEDGAFPDCSRNFYNSFQHLMENAIAAKPPRLVTPLLDMGKKAIVDRADELSVPLHLTHSCYNPLEEAACGLCDACVLRAGLIKTSIL